MAWWLLDLLKRRWSATAFREEELWLRSVAELEGAGDVWLIKPLVYMNRSGVAVRALIQLADLDLMSDLLVVVDDVALDPGRPRFRPRGSAGGHNGLQSVEVALGTREYPRLRIGVGSPPPGSDLAEWVLSEFDNSEHEEAVLNVLPRLADGVEVWVREGLEMAMNRFNVTPDAEEQ